MTPAMARVTRGYRLIHLAMGGALGAWQGVYSWYLHQRLEFSAAQIAITVIASFVPQILLEIPAGALADSGRTRTLMAIAACAQACFCVLFAWAGFVDPQSRLLFVTLAEVFYGVGAALISGTFEAWMVDAYRNAGAYDQMPEEKRQRQVQRQFATMSSGTLFFGLALRAGESGTVLPRVLPWAAAALLYASALMLALHYLPNDLSRGTMREVSSRLFRHTCYSLRHALAFLQERKEARTFLLQSAAAFMPFLCLQPYWFGVLRDYFDLNDTDDLRLVSFHLPLFAVVWMLGEASATLGAFASGKFSPRRGKQLEEPGEKLVKGSRRRIAALLLAYAILVGPGLLFVVSWRRFHVSGMVFALSACRFVEAIVRQRLDVLNEDLFKSERATHQSIVTFCRSLLGVAFFAIGGAIFSVDVRGGCLFIATIALGAALGFMWRSALRRLGAVVLIAGPILIWWHAEGAADIHASLISIQSHAGRKLSAWTIEKTENGAGRSAADHTRVHCDAALDDVLSSRLIGAEQVAIVPGATTKLSFEMPNQSAELTGQVAARRFLHCREILSSDVTRPMAVTVSSALGPGMNETPALVIEIIVALLALASAGFLAARDSFETSYGMLRALADQARDEAPSSPLLDKALQALGAECLVLAAKPSDIGDWRHSTYPEAARIDGGKFVEANLERELRDDSSIKDTTTEVYGRQVASRFAISRGSPHVGLVIVVYRKDQPARYIDPLDRIVLEALARAAVRLPGAITGVHVAVTPAEVQAARRAQAVLNE